MGVVRHFDGSSGAPPNDYLLTPNSSDSYAGLTWAGWVKRDGTGTRNGLTGRLWDSGNGWSVYIDAADLFSFFSTNSIVTVAAPDLSNWTFLAVTYDSAASSPQVRFYAGTTQANIAEIGTATKTGTFGELGTYGIAVGWVTFGNLHAGGALNAWNGSLDQVGVWYGALTLFQIREAAVCGTLVEEGNSKFIADITGYDPEPITQGGSPQSLSVVGTTVVSASDIGCDLAGATLLHTTDAFISLHEETILVSELIRQAEYLEIADLLPQTCSLIPRVRLRRLDDLIQVMELTGYEFLRYTKVWQGIGEFELLINGQSEKALEMIEKGVVGNIGSPSSINNFILEVSYDGVSDFAGIIDFPSVEWMDDGTEMLRLVGPDLKRWMADRIIVPPTGLEYDSYADLQETIIKSMIDRHLVNPIATDALGFNDAQRAIDYLLVSTDLLRGSATTFEGRGQSLFSAVSEVANFANEFGFDFYIQNDQVIFDLFDGENRSDYVVFDIALGNVSNFKSEWDGMNFASHALLAGQGEGVARTMRTAQTSPQTYTGPRRREVFQDARDLNTAAKLLDRGTAVIRDRSRILRLSAEKIQSLGPCYKDDFNLGDIVTVRNSKYNVSQAVKIYEVQVVHQAQRAPQVLLTWNTPSAPSALKLIRDDIAPGSSRT